MKNPLRHRRGRILTLAALVPIVAAVAFALYLASVAGSLPWQVDPTRVSVQLTPFAGTGFDAPALVPVKAAATPAK